MSSLDIRKKIDLAVTILIVFFFGIGITFNILKLESSFENYIMFLILVIVMIISYYTNITLSLIVSLVVDFVYMSIKLYFALGGNSRIDISTYFWTIIIIISAILISNISSLIFKMQKEITELRERNNNLVMIDHETGMRNSRAFMNELPIYISMTRRRKDIPITVMVVNIQYSDKIKGFLGEEKYKDVITFAVNRISTLLRGEDRKYIINDSTFAYILLSTEEGARVVMKRLKEEIKKIVLDEDSLLGGLNLEIQVGYKAWSEDIKDPIDFLRRAEAEVEYDV
ncbi:diguanylate cyclase domain-containing protein [Clostridium sardiniense]|uniref:diguanylate cyclase domain-containing protein n=1 Tax=Clostridium sardiniense TaxID=29369 RepID=UPI0019590F95|nr:GGDEF domain-containing protein [Clostridium sardiniense]